MTKVRITLPARSDLDEIWEYLADHAGLSVADRVMSDFERAFDRLARHPGVGHARPDLSDEACRFATVHSYLVAYRADDPGVTVLRVLHAARDISSERFAQ